MKKFPAIATVEFKEIPVGILATDAMLKKAPLSLFKSGTISHGRYLTLIGGSTASVEESYKEGLECGQESVLDHIFLPDIHPGIYDAIITEKRVALTGDAMAILETRTVSSNIFATEIALKGTLVDLVELRLADSLLDGKALSILHGPLHDIEASIDLAVHALTEKNREVSCRVITSPEESLTRGISASTHFLSKELSILDGEI
ncbi:MAG: BMC domain-containing protein [Kiritimatiellae bacterium]|nr:BMC domain-containing protein [Kiritimatiellia bacterium]